MSTHMYHASVENENIGQRVFLKNGLNELKVPIKNPLKDKNVVHSTNAAPKGQNVPSEKQCVEQDQIVQQNVVIEDDSDEESFFPEPVPDLCYDIIPRHLVLTKEDIRNLVYGYLKPIEKTEIVPSTESIDDYEGMPESPLWNPFEFEKYELDDDLPPLPPLD